MSIDNSHDYFAAAAVLASRIGRVPEVAVVLGSGLGDWADKLDSSVAVPYAQVAGMPRSTVAGHAGRFVFGSLGSTAVAAMQGRVHFYEGYTPAEVVFPVRVLAALGVKTLILTNAAGGVNAEFRAGDLMLIRDHISLVPSPLTGANDERLGPRFPDLSAVYDAELCERILASESGRALRQGVYLQTSGPQYETPAEVRAYRTLGADAVGMSTAIEATAARHAGLRVVGVSCITNPAAGIGGPLSHEEVQTTAARVKTRFSSLLDTVVTLAAER